MKIQSISKTIQRSTGSVALVLCLLLGSLFTARATTNAWTGLGDGADWFDGANWSAGVPAAAQEVTVDAGSLLLTNETAELAAFTLSGGTLTFSNWTTRLQATEVDLQGGEVTLPPAFRETQMSNRVWIVCSNFTLAASATMDLQGLGYAFVNGPGAATASGRTGASHGGKAGRGGGAVDVPPCYGSATGPEIPGSGGSYDSGNEPHQGAGGGAVRIEASGRVAVKGPILADGADGRRYGGGGSGGAVYVTCDEFAGDATGLISAGGGSVPMWGDGVRHSGGGGGGRIAVWYDQLEGGTAVRFRATPGVGNADQAEYRFRHRAGQGTLYLSDKGLLSGVISGEQFRDVLVSFSGLKAWSVSSLMISNASLTFADPDFVMTVTNDVRIGSGGGLGIHGELVTLGGNLSLTNGGTLHVYSSPTEGNVEAYGARVSVTGDLRVASGSWIYPFSHETDGGTPLIEAWNVWIGAGGGINADGGGYGSETGPGAGASNRGGGYGGRGGGGPSGGPVYGLVDAANQPGSGGGNALQGGFGGGCVRMAASGSVTLDGTISANGLRTWGTGGAGGSGGGIDVRCDVLEGAATGFLEARGGGGTWHSSGAWYGYSGGGGRIALEYNTLAPGFAACLGAGYDEGAHLNGLVTGRPLRPELGTLWTPDAALLSPDLSVERFRDINLFPEGMQAWSVDSLSIGNSSFHFGPSDFVLTVTNDLDIGSGGHLGVRGDLVVQSGAVTVRTGGALSVYSSATNGAQRAFGGLVDVGGELAVENGAWIYPHSHPTDGGSVLFRVGTLTVATNGGFDADALGFEWGTGPGAGKSQRTGGGYGGRGGDNGSGIGGDTYGVAFAPTLPGSGGGGSATAAGFGGGLVWIEAENAIRLDGVLRACGMGALTTGGGGGSGGGILLAGPNITSGPGALLTVDGGQAVKHSASTDPDGWYTAGGGGGRIAVWLGVSDAVKAGLIDGDEMPGVEPDADPFPRFEALLSAEGGPGYEDGEPGTIRFVDGRPKGTMFLLR